MSTNFENLLKVNQEMYEKVMVSPNEEINAHTIGYHQSKLFNALENLAYKFYPQDKSFMTFLNNSSVLLMDEKAKDEFNRIFSRNISREYNNKILDEIEYIKGKLNDAEIEYQKARNYFMAYLAELEEFYSHKIPSLAKIALRDLPQYENPFIVANPSIRRAIRHALKQPSPKSKSPKSKSPKSKSQKSKSPKSRGGNNTKKRQI